MRYSEKRLAEDFTAYVLFSEPFQGRVGEILAATAVDYPELDWSSHQMGSALIDTRSVTLSSDLGRAGSTATDPSRGPLSFFGTPGRCQIDWEDVIGKSRLIFPDGRRAVQRHTDYVGVRVGSAPEDTSIPARFDAARRMTCITAILASLPGCTGVYFPNGDTLVTPANWVRAAQTAMRGEVPVMDWMTLFVASFGAPSGPAPVSVSTIGLAAFTGHEIVMPKVPLGGDEAVRWVWCAVKMLLEAGHVFADGDTFGAEGAGAEPIRVRHAIEGQHEAQTDQWVLVHPTSPIDDIKLFGPRGRRSAAAGRGPGGVSGHGGLKDRLYGFVSNGH